MKQIKTAMMASLSALMLAGCGGSSQVAEQPAAETAPSFVQACEYQPGVAAPEWYCNPDVAGGIAAIGEARPNPARDNNMQRAQAMANGRDAIAQQVEVKVQSMLTNWSRSTGAGEGQTYEANFENVSRQVAQQTLSGVRQLNRWMAPDGTLVLHVGMTETTSVREGLMTNLRNEQALWQQFQSQQSLQELDRQLEAAFQ